jgi:predicted MFS family arabinose efflux permease
MTHARLWLWIGGMLAGVALALALGVPLGPSWSWLPS